MRRFLALLAAVTLLLGVCNTAGAAETPDLTQNGTITFHVHYGDAKVDGGYVSLYRVGNVVNNNGSYSFSLISSLKAYEEKVDINATDDPDTARKLAELVEEENIYRSKRSKIVDGAVTFENVIPGLYVVIQDTPSPGYEAMAPFLISMPRYEDGVYKTEVTASPKVPIETTPADSTEPTGSTPPTKPTSPLKPPPGKLPQTGQLNWPIPLLAMTGVVMFVLGWYLCYGGKKEKA